MHPDTIVATGKLDAIAVKPGKAIEAKLILNRDPDGWTIDDLLEMQGTSVITIVLQPYMRQGTLPIVPPMAAADEEETESPRFLIDGQVFPILEPNDVDGYVLTGRELRDLVDAEQLWQLVPEQVQAIGSDPENGDPIFEEQIRRYLIEDDSRYLLTDRDLFTVLPPEEAEADAMDGPYFWLDGSRMALELEEGKDYQRITGDLLLGMALDEPLWIAEKVPGQTETTWCQIDEGTEYYITDGDRLVTKDPTADSSTSDDVENQEAPEPVVPMVRSGGH